ncbi:MAG: class I SAM-dependent methyltransferase [Gammaproteobacteria bacterium]
MSRFWSPDELESISSATIEHYNANATSFWHGTKDHDVTQNYEALLSALPKQKGLSLLDLGCGPGRDLLYFKNEGHHAIGLDGSHAFCEMARSLTGLPVLQQDFLKLDLPEQFVDGIFANASLFHVPFQEMLRVLKELRSALKPRGVLFSSNPRGNSEGWQGDRYGTYLEIASYQLLLEAAGFEIIKHYYRPRGLPCAEQPWLAVVGRKAV